MRQDTQPNYMGCGFEQTVLSTIAFLPKSYLEAMYRAPKKAHLPTGNGHSEAGSGHRSPTVLGLGTRVSFSHQWDRGMGTHLRKKMRNDVMDFTNENTRPSATAHTFRKRRVQPHMLPRFLASTEFEIQLSDFSRPKKREWTPPPAGWIKLNCDAHIRQEDAVVAVVVRNSRKGHPDGFLY
ncbi:hypothetical protein PanWU01x14_300800 [Parasponia andersonii]|uniref:Uncharacterized protein n=1 Tax=Parasponia andersonii TaxID=3476 RepID=A0A2P5ATS4_PARAD|nr:hypothetical protein PanWU01x14_300800 [Parasponia andersonii]